MAPRRVVQGHRLGEALHTLTKRVDAWKDERASLAVHLRELVGSAHALLSDLGHAASAEGGRVRRGGRPKGYKMSAETRAKLRAAWARRKAAAAADGRSPAQSAGGRKKRTMSAEARARISAAQKARWAKARRG